MITVDQVDCFHPCYSHHPTYEVEIGFAENEKHRILFACSAESSDHAVELAFDAFPKAKILKCQLVDSTSIYKTGERDGDN